MSASSHLLSELHGTSSLVVGSICVALALIGVVLKRRSARPQEQPLLLPADLETGGWDVRNEHDLEYSASTGWRAPMMASGSAFEPVESAWPVAAMATGDHDDDDDEWQRAAEATAAWPTQAEAPGDGWTPSSIIL